MCATKVCKNNCSIQLTKSISPFLTTARGGIINLVSLFKTAMQRDKQMVSKESLCNIQQENDEILLSDDGF